MMITLYHYYSTIMGSSTSEISSNNIVIELDGKELEDPTDFMSKIKMMVSTVLCLKQVRHVHRILFMVTYLMYRLQVEI